LDVVCCGNQNLASKNMNEIKRKKKKKKKNNNIIMIKDIFIYVYIWYFHILKSMVTIIIIMSHR
jgi:predicted nucleic acid-binding Zn ribbon protein